MFSEEIKVGKNYYIVLLFSEYKIWVVLESESVNV